MPTQIKPFVINPKQYEALKLFKSEARHILLYGGARSSKTFIILMNLIDRAVSTTSRHLILRRHFNHVKTSIWLDTLPDVTAIRYRSTRMTPTSTYALTTAPRYG